MADITSVIAKITDALNSACDVSGLPHPADQITTLTAQVDALTTANANLQAKIDAAKAALA